MTLSKSKQTLFAAAELINRANAKLNQTRSGVLLITGDEISGGLLGSRSLHRVTPYFNSDAYGGADSLYQDCGRAAREILGPFGQNSAPSARFRDRSGAEARTAPDDQPDDLRKMVLAETIRERGAPPQPHNELDAYANQDAKNAEEFDKTHGINDWAVPDVGEAYVKVRAPNAAFKKKGKTPGYDYHWAAVVLAPGEDRVTLENSAVSGDIHEMNNNWKFQTYGPPNSSQSFHDSYGFTLGREDGAMTMVMSPNDYGRISTTNLIRRYNDKVEGDHHPSVRAEILDRYMWVTVEVDDATDFYQDEVYVSITGPGKEGQTYVSSSKEIHQLGGFDTFKVQLKHVFKPVWNKSDDEKRSFERFEHDKPVVIEVYDQEPFADELIMRLDWSYAPNGPDAFPTLTETVENDDQSHTVKVMMDSPV